MSLTVTTIIASAGDLLDDTTIPDPTTTALGYLNDGRRELAIETKCITDTGSKSSEAYVQRYTLDNNVIGIMKVRYDYGLTSHAVLDPKTKKEYDEEAFTSTADSYGSYFFDMTDRAMYLSPPVASAATTNACSGSVTSAATSISMSATCTFHINGRGIIDSEVIGWQYASGSTLLGVQRGLEGTSAAAHSSGATITERDIVYDFYKLPASLSSGAAVEQVFELFPYALVYYICMRAKEKDTDDTNPSGGLALEGSFRQKYEQEKEKIRYHLNRTYDGPRTVREV